MQAFFSAAFALLGFDNRIFGQHHDTGFGHVEELLVALQVVTDLETCGDMQAFLDDGTADLGSGANGHVGEQDGFFHQGVLLDGDAGGEDALDHGTATDDTARRNDGVDGRTLVGIAFAGKEPCRGLVPVKGTDRPVVVVKVEGRVLGAQVHVGFEEGIQGSHVAPVALGRGLLATDDVGIEVVHVDGVVLIQAGDNVLAEVRGAVAGALHEFPHQELAGKDVVAHAGQAVAGVAGHFLGVLGLFLETDHAVVRIYLDNAEFRGFGHGHGDSGNGQKGCTAQVEIDHLIDVHLVDVVAAKDGHQVRPFVGNQVDVLENGVGGATVPVVAGTHLGGHQVHVLVQARVQVPGGRNVLVQGVALELGQDLNLEDARVDEVVQHKVDNAVGSAKMDGGLCTVAGEGLKTATLTACHNHTKDVFLVFSRVGPVHISSKKCLFACTSLIYLIFWKKTQKKEKSTFF